MKVAVKLTVVMEYDRPTKLSEEEMRFFLEGNHCTSNVVRHLAKLVETDDAESVCNLCSFATVEVLPEGTPAYRGYVKETS